MLRASARENETSVELLGLTDPTVEIGVPSAPALIGFVDALVAGRGSLADSRAALVAEIGEPGTARAAAVAGNFEMMNRLLDATGVPLGGSARGLARQLGINPAGFGHSG